jgi:UDP-N-acetylmuramoylalanine--D-glutamate ligase
MTVPSCKTLTILGASTSGLAVAQLASYLGYTDILVSEYNPIEKIPTTVLEAFNSLSTVTIETGKHSPACCSHANTVVVSPGIPPHSPIIQQLQQANRRICSEVTWALEQTASSVITGIGITGTNGKTTVTTLTQWLLQQNPTTVATACGNIGLPVASVVLQALQNNTPTTAVMELSSYQLTYSDTLPHLTISAFTNLTPDHLDWHGTIDAYASAKSKLFIGELAPNWVVLNADDATAQQWMRTTNAKVLAYSLTPNNPTFQFATQWLWVEHATLYHQSITTPAVPLFSLEQFQLKGTHNIENILASVSIALLSNTPIQAIQTGINTFAGVEHRCERVPIPAYPTWQVYNDSKATNPEACIKAIQGFKPKQVVLIAGGKAKGTPLEAWATTVVTYCNTVILNGADQTCFAEALLAEGFTGSIHHVSTQAEAVELAKQHLVAQPNHTVLFSPATASFDQFKNFEARGNAFKQQVQAWQPIPATLPQEAFTV